jgi:hypothetical protein
MGGVPPLGYRGRDRKLVIVDSEAELARSIFRRYAELGSVRLLKEELQVQGTIMSQSRRKLAPEATAYGLWRPLYSAESGTEFAEDSSLEGTGFELSVPREIGLGYEALSFFCRHKSPGGPPRAPMSRGETRPRSMSAGLRRKAVCGSGCAETAKALGLTIPPAVLAMAD